MSSNGRSVKWIVIPLFFALVLLMLFGLDGLQEWLSVMTVGFICFLPFGVGFLTVLLSKYERTEKRAYQILAPWVPILLFFALTLILQLEGWACWIMVLPLFLLFASVGGVSAAGVKHRRRSKRSQTFYVTFVALLPLLVSPMEQLIGPSDQVYKAYTSIDLQAPKEVIWSHVTRVREIAPKEDKGLLTRHLGFPRPLTAELNYEGVGAYRKAIFSKGLVFHEEVLQYEHQKRMFFSITANPYDIPSTTMDKHVVIGGDYFDVLNGTYELEPLQSGKYRLHLYSHFTLNTTFNFYASLWAKWIMKDIQNNILQVIKARVEHP